MESKLERDKSGRRDEMGIKKAKNKDGVREYIWNSVMSTLFFSRIENHRPHKELTQFSKLWASFSLWQWMTYKVEREIT